MRVHVLLALLTATALASFGASASGRYVVSAELSHQGDVFASPVVTVEAGAPATVRVSGSDAFTLTIEAKGSGAGRIQVAASVDSKQGVMAPTMLVEPGVPASVRVGDLGLTLTVATTD